MRRYRVRRIRVGWRQVSFRLVRHPIPTGWVKLIRSGRDNKWVVGLHEEYLFEPVVYLGPRFPSLLEAQEYARHLVEEHCRGHLTPGGARVQVHVPVGEHPWRGEGTVH